MLSQQAPSELLFLADEDFPHPMLAPSRPLADGFTALASAGRAARRSTSSAATCSTAPQMRPLPPTCPGPDNDLADLLDHYVGRADRPTRRARVYAFGQRWGPEPTAADKIFGFPPGNGVHDIHMNQGNDRPFAATTASGRTADCCSTSRRPSSGSAIFLAFQSQAWHTDDTTGHALPTSAGPGARPDRPAPGAHRRRAGQPDRPGARAGDGHAAQPAAGAIDLAGWSLVDRPGHGAAPAGRWRPATPLRIALLPRSARQPRRHVTLLDPAGLKVDGVAYTGEQGRRTPGLTLVF